METHDYIVTFTLYSLHKVKGSAVGKQDGKMCY